MQAPKRGSTECTNCGGRNGNRAVTCKQCGALLPGKQPKRARTISTTVEVSALVKGEGIKQRIFSCRVRREGPDYRTFVVEKPDGKWTCCYKNCTIAQSVRSRSGPASEEVEEASFCEHIITTRQDPLSLPVQRVAHMGGIDQEQLVPVKPSVLSELAIPPDMREKLLKLYTVSPHLIQRVSGEMFVVRDIHETQQHPLGLLHVRLQRTDKTSSIAQRHQLFFCPCSSFKAATSSSSSICKPSRRCLHIYICIWAVASNPILSKEFPIKAATSTTVEGELYI